jgi:hypothetical protein
MLIILSVIIGRLSLIPLGIKIADEQIIMALLTFLAIDSDQPKKIML